MTEDLESHTVQCPGCGNTEHTVSVEDTMYEAFSNIQGIEDNILEGTAKFHCWDCMQLVEADTRIALVDFIDASEREIREVIEQQREELDSPRFVRELTEEDREMAENEDGSLFSSMDRSYSE